MKKCKIDIISGIALTAVSVIYLIHSLHIYERPGVSSGRLVPQLAGGALLCLSVLLICQGTFVLIREKKYAMAEAVSDVSEKPVSDKSNYLKVALTLIFFAAYILILKPVGFLISSFLFMCAEMYLLASKDQRDKRGIVIIVITAFIAALALFLLFRYAFKVMLPMGVLS